MILDGNGNFMTTNMTTVGTLLNLTSTTLPVCSTTFDGTIGRNATGIYNCNSTNWNCVIARGGGNIC